MAKKRDSQLSGLAGEFFAAAELLKRDFQTLVTLGNAKAIDLMAIHPTTGRKFSIQVKTLRDPNYFLIDGGKCSREHIYVFVLLNKPGVPVEHFIVSGATLVDEPSRFGKCLKIEKMPGIRPQDLKQFKDNWGVFDEPQAQDSPARRFPRLSPLHRVAADYRARARQGYRAMAPEMMHGQRILSIWIIYFVDPIAVWRDSRCDVNAPVRITVAPTRRTRSDPLPLTARSRRPGDGAEELRSRKRLGQ